MGGDRRLMTPLQAPSVETLTPDHLPPIPGESMEEYARRTADLYRIGPADVIGGASFGGMVAAEIADKRKVSGLVLLGSCLRPSRLPFHYRWVEKLGPFVPDVALALRSFRPLVRGRFHPLTRDAEDCLIAMARDCPPEQIREFGRMIIAWPGVERPSCPILSINGDRDRVIPTRCSEPGLLLPSAGHAFTLTHSAQVSAAIQNFIVALPVP